MFPPSTPSIRRSRPLLAAALLVLPLALSVVPGVAAAQREPAPLPSYAFGIGLGYYDPAVGGPAAAQQFEDDFGAGTPLLFDLRIGRYLPYLISPRVGLVGLELGAGLWRAEGVGANAPQFMTVPVELSLTFRQATLWERWQIPFILYLRGGFTYGFWWSMHFVAAADPEGGAEGTQASGGTAGIHGSAGLGLVLDWSGRTRRGARGLPVLIAEIGQSWVNDFSFEPRPGRVDLSSTRFQVRLAVDL